jgi:hypothetical protein
MANEYGDARPKAPATRAAGQENVLRLDVAVQGALAVRVREGLGHSLAIPIARRMLMRGSVSSGGAQRLPGDQGHRVVRQPAASTSLASGR